MRIRDWRIPFFVLLVCGLCEWSWASCPILPHSDPAEEREFQNLCQQVVNPVINVGSASTMTITNIVGATSGTSACTTCIGYETESIVGAVNYPTSGNYGDATTLPLTAGCWEITGWLEPTASGATWSQAFTGISTTSGNSSAGLTAGSNLATQSWANSAATPLAADIIVPNYHVCISASTTYYLKMRAIYTLGTPQTNAGRLSAIRSH